MIEYSKLDRVTCRIIPANTTLYAGWVVEILSLHHLVVARRRCSPKSAGILKIGALKPDSSTLSEVVFCNTTITTAGKLSNFSVHDKTFYL